MPFPLLNPCFDFATATGVSGPGVNLLLEQNIEPGNQAPNFNRYRVSPARVPVIGYKEVIQGLSRDDVYAYYKLAYVPNNMMFVAVGDRDPEELLATVRRNVGDIKPGRAFGHNDASAVNDPTHDMPRAFVR